MKQLTVRIPDEFHGDVAGYAARIGISVNQLILVALNDYLLARTVGVQKSDSDDNDALPDSDDNDVLVERGDSWVDGYRPEASKRSKARKKRRR